MSSQTKPQSSCCYSLLSPAISSQRSSLISTASAVPHHHSSCSCFLCFSCSAPPFSPLLLLCSLPSSRLANATKLQQTPRGCDLLGAAQSRELAPPLVTEVARSVQRVSMLRWSVSSRPLTRKLSSFRILLVPDVPTKTNFTDYKYVRKVTESKNV